MHLSLKRKRKPQPKTSFLTRYQERTWLYQFRLRRNYKRGHGTAVSLRQINCRETALPFPEFGQY